MAALSVCLAPHAAQARARADFNIAPQPLERALIAFADQTHASLALPDHSIADARSPGAIGRFDEQSALHRLLSGTGYTYERAGDHAFRIIAEPQSATHVDEAVRTEAIIVTAARIPRMLQDLPRSITDVSGERLEQTQAHDLASLASEISGVQFTNVGDGRNKPYLRGLSDGAATGRAQSTVGLYLDGVRLTYAAADPDLQLIDVHRVDVLRGPQGALYGAGSIGGVISVESNAPDASAFYGSILGRTETTEHGGASYNGELVLNAPLIENRLAIRYAGYAQTSSGWLDNTTTGATNSNEAKRNGSRLSVQYEISPHWSMREFGVIQAIDSADSQYLTQTPSGYQRNARIAEPHDNDFLMTGFTLHGETPFGDIESTSAQVHHEINSRYDASGSFSGFGVNPALARPMDENNELNIFVHETRLSAPAGARLPWFAGVFIADGDSTSMQTLRDGAPNVWSTIAYRENRTDSINELALFGETTWRFTPTLSLITGARYFHLDLKTAAATAEPLVSLGNETHGALSDSGIAPDIRLAYQPHPDWLFYLSAAEGYRSAGFNTGEPIGSGFSTATQPFRRYQGDQLWSYEAGSRMSLFDGRVTVNAAAFFNQWKNAQTDQLTSGALAYTGNIGDIRAYGFEGDVSWALTNSLHLRSHVLVNEPDIVRRDPSFPADVHHLPGAPELLASASLHYERSMDAITAGARGALELSVSHVGSSPADFDDNAQLDGYTELDASLRFSTDDYEATLYVSNLLDEAGQTFSMGDPYITPSAPAITQLRPATLGFSLKRRF